MRLYVLEKEKLHKFNLPHKIEGSFLFSYKSKNMEKIINIEAYESKWQLKYRCSSKWHDSAITYLTRTCPL